MSFAERMNRCRSEHSFDVDGRTNCPSDWSHTQPDDYTSNAAGRPAGRPRAVGDIAAAAAVWLERRSNVIHRSLQHVRRQHSELDEWTTGLVCECTRRGFNVRHERSRCMRLCACANDQPTRTNERADFRGRMTRHVQAYRAAQWRRRAAVAKAAGIRPQAANYSIL